MSSRRPDLIFLGVLLLAIVLIATLTWANYQFALSNPGGNDFIPRWVAARLAPGVSPYSEQTNQAIQEVIYGQAARATEDQQFFVYPYYALAVFFPFGLVEDLNLARALWMTALEIALLALAIVSLSLAHWKPSLPLLALLLIFSLAWYHALRALINGNAAALVALFVALALYAIRLKRDALAGVLLALASIKPHMVVLLTPFILLWAISRRRWSLVVTILVSHLLFLTVPLLAQRDWIIQNLRQIVTYIEHTRYPIIDSPIDIFSRTWPGVGVQLQWIFVTLLALLLLLEWWRALGKDFRWFFWTACLTLAVTNLIGIPTATVNYVALFPAIVLVLATWHQRWGWGGRVLAAVTLFALLVGLWVLMFISLPDQPHVLQPPVMFFPVPIFVLLALYWVRWWALRPPRLPIEHIRALQDL